MPDPEFILAPGANDWMPDFAWDPLKDEIFMTRNIRSSNGRKRSRSTGSVLLMIKVCGTLHLGHDAYRCRHGDVLGLQRKGNALLLWVNWTHYSGNARFRDLVRSQWKSGTYN